MERLTVGEAKKIVGDVDVFIKDTSLCVKGMPDDLSVFNHCLGLVKQEARAYFEKIKGEGVGDGLVWLKGRLETIGGIGLDYGFSDLKEGLKPKVSLLGSEIFYYTNLQWWENEFGKPYCLKSFGNKFWLLEGFCLLKVYELIETAINEIEAQKTTEAEQKAMGAAIKNKLVWGDEKKALHELIEALAKTALKGNTKANIVRAFEAVFIDAKGEPMDLKRQNVSASESKGTIYKEDLFCWKLLEAACEVAEVNIKKAKPKGKE